MLKGLGGGGVRVLGDVLQGGTLLVTLRIEGGLAEPFFFQVLSMSEGRDYQVVARKEYQIREGVASFVHTLFYWGEDLAAAQSDLRALLIVRASMPPSLSAPVATYSEPPSVIPDAPLLPPPPTATSKPYPLTVERLPSGALRTRCRLAHVPEGMDRHAPPARTLHTPTMVRARVPGEIWAYVQSYSEQRGDPHAP